MSVKFLINSYHYTIHDGEQILFKVMLVGQGFAVKVNNLILKINVVNRFKAFAQKIRENKQDLLIIDASELLISYNPLCQILRISEECQIEGHELVCNFLTRLHNEIEYHINGVLCKRDFMTLNQEDEELINRLVERKTQYDQFPCYELYDFRVTQDETGFHIFYWPINEKSVAEKYSVRLMKKETFPLSTFMSDTRKYDIVFDPNLRYVKLGKDTISGLRNAVTLLAHLRKILVSGIL